MADIIDEIEDDVMIIIVVAIVIFIIMLLMDMLSMFAGRRPPKPKAGGSGLSDFVENQVNNALQNAIEGAVERYTGVLSRQGFEEVAGGLESRGYTLSDIESVVQRGKGYIDEVAVMDVAESTFATRNLDSALQLFRGTESGNLQESLGNLLNLSGAFQNFQEAINHANNDAKQTANEVIQNLLGVVSAE